MGFDTDPARCEALAAAGVEIAASVAVLAGKTTRILSSLPNHKALDHTVAALLASGVAGLTLIELSTLPIAAKQSARDALAGPGHVMHDCPLSGTGAQARTKDLTVYASGDTAAIAATAAVFAGFAKASFDLGAFGNGSRMKYVANLLVFIHNVAAAEALVLGEKAGLDPQQIVDVVKLGAGGSRMLEVRGPLMARGQYTPVTAGFPMYYKDLGVISQFAMDLDCPTPLLSASLPYYLAGGAAYPEEDVAAVHKVLARMAGLTPD